MNAQLVAVYALVDKQATEALALARDAAGLTPPPPAGPAPDPLPALVEDFLDLRYERGSRQWRQQYAEARKLVAQGKEPLDVNEILARGQPVEW